MLWCGVELENTDRPQLQAGQPVSIPLYYLNFGKLPADARVTTAVVFSHERLEHSPSFAESVERHLFIWPPPILNPGDVFSARSVSDGQVSDVEKGKRGGWVYLRVQILYGGHRTEVCLEWDYSRAKFRSLPKVQYDLCPDLASNYAD